MDIKLSKRMQAVADMAQGDCIADIGCDHAFVSIYLLQKNIAKKVIAMDVKQGPLDIARRNICGYGLEEKIDVRESDGFEALGESEADTAIIAGMGGALMIKILEEGRKHTENAISLVLQPQSEIEKVRKYLADIGYEIIDEKMLIDEDKYYTVMKAKATREHITYNEEELLFGPILLKRHDDCLRKYLLKEKIKNNNLIKRLDEKATDKSLNRIVELKHYRDVLEKALWQDD